MDGQAMAQLHGVPCYLTGMMKNAPGFPLGLDRKDSSLGYRGGNAVACCTVANLWKGTMSLPELKATATRVLAVARLP